MLPEPIQMKQIEQCGHFITISDPLFTAEDGNDVPAKNMHLCIVITCIVNALTMARLNFINPYANEKYFENNILN